VLGSLSFTFTTAGDGLEDKPLLLQVTDIDTFAPELSLPLSVPLGPETVNQLGKDV
jgi:hypothetical protein